MEFEINGLARDDGDVAKAVAAARPAPRHALAKAVVINDVVFDEQIEDRLFAVVDVAAVAVALNVRDDDGWARHAVWILGA